MLKYIFLIIALVILLNIGCSNQASGKMAKFPEKSCENSYKNEDLNEKLVSGNKKKREADANEMSYIFAGKR